MLLVVKKSNCKYLKDISYYNHNFYELPFELEECKVIQEVYDESWNTYSYVFGRLDHKKFKPLFTVDSECSVDMAGYLIAFEALIAI